MFKSIYPKDVGVYPFYVYSEMRFGASVMGDWGFYEKSTLAAMSLMCVPAFASTVYVQSNEPAGNSLLAYSLSANGELTPQMTVATAEPGSWMPASLWGHMIPTKRSL